MRLATFNILHGRSPADDRVDVNRFAAAVASLDADVLGLQEVDRDQPRSQGADLTAVAAEAMGAPEHRFVAAVAGTPGGTWLAATGEEQPGSAHYGVALLSRYPVLSWRVLRLPALLSRVPMVFPGRRRPVLVSDEPRVAVAAVVGTPHGQLTAVTTHLSFIPYWNGRQLRRLVADLDSSPHPVLVTGDLNMGPDRAARVTGGRSLASHRTFPSTGPRLQLDHLLAIGDVPEPRGSGACELPVSDHRALWVDLGG